MAFVFNPFTGKLDIDNDAQDLSGYVQLDQTSASQVGIGELRFGQFYAQGYGTYNFYGGGDSYFGGIANIGSLNLISNAASINSDGTGNFSNGNIAWDASGNLSAYTLGVNPGDAAGPSVVNFFDMDTGIFFPSTNTLGITTGGTERARIDSTGTMFLGTTSLPGALAAKLAVKYTHDGSTNYEAAIDAMNDVLLTTNRAGNFQYGLNFTVQKRGDYNFGSQRGVISFAYQYGTGATTNTMSFLGGGPSFRGAGANGSVTNGYVFYGLSPTQISGALGTVGTMYGVYLEEMKKSFVTTAYSFYQAGASDLNYFAGQLTPTKRTASLPPYSFSGDQDTGIWSAGANLIDFACAGVNLFEMTTAFSEPVLASKTSTAVNLQANGGQNVFRGLDGWTGTWADAVATSYFQVGRANANTMFSAYTGTPFNRLSYTTATGAGKGVVYDTLTSGYVVPAAYFDIRIAGVTKFAVGYNGFIGIGTQTPTAALHLPACTAAANTASLKITPGVLATVPVSGNIESDGTNLYWTDAGGTRRQLN